MKKAIHFFHRVAGLTRVLFFEIIAIAGISSVLSTAIGRIVFRNCEGYHGEWNWYVLAFLVIAVIAARAVWLRIWYASYTTEGFHSALKVGGWVFTPNPLTGTVKFYMPTTHPSYVFMDLIMVAIGGLFAWIGSHADVSGPCGWDYQYYFGWSMIALALLVPIVRLVVWYGFKHKIPKEYCKGAWIPVLLFWILALAMIIPGIIVSFSG
jgi:hypothetical protein